MPVFKCMDREGVNRAWSGITRAVDKYSDAQGFELVVRRPSKKRAQEERYHAIIGDIARVPSITYQGNKLVFADYPHRSADVAKAALLVWFQDDLRAQGETLSNPGTWVTIPGASMPVMIRAKSSEFSVKEGGWFIEFLMSVVAENGIRLSDPETRAYEEMAQQAQ